MDISCDIHIKLAHTPSNKVLLDFSWNILATLISSSIVCNILFTLLEHF